LFVASFSSQEHAYTIGEYMTSGSTVNASLITGFDSPQGIAISGNDLFVSNTGDGTVGEYTISGGTVNTDLISGLSGPYGIAISPVPEPSTVALAALGVAILCLRRWRK
jgi:DNA-binding beta-propeller fold protein YncE